MKDGGTLLLQTDLIDDQKKQVVRVMVGDSGPGIKPEVLDKIFTPFFTTKTQGTGLGLAICRQLIEQQGGTIDIKSRVGEGSRVLIDLPVSSDAVSFKSEDERA